MCEKVTKQKTPLAAAIERSTPALDAAAMAYMTSVPASIDGVVLPSQSFNTAKFTQDVLASFSGLKRLEFDGLGTVAFDNIQGALTKNEASWRLGPLKNDIFVVQQFCLRLVELINSLKERTGSRIANDVAAFAEADGPRAAAQSGHQAGLRGRAAAQSGQQAAPRRPLVYNAAAGRIKGGPDWPQCVNVDDEVFAGLFGPKADDEEGGPWLTPRMAARIHHVAVVEGDTMLDDWQDCPPRLPKVARPFFRRSREWRESFRDCYLRIAMRLQKGLPPRPNCTGEEMAFHNILERVPDVDEECEDTLESLPEYPNDDDFDMVRDCAIQDEDVLMLIDDDDDDGYGFDEDEPSVDNPVLGPQSMAAFMLGSGGDMMNTAHLHPSEWFHAFKEEHFRDPASATTLHTPLDR